MGKGLCKYVYIYDNVSQHERFGKESFVENKREKKERIKC